MYSVNVPLPLSTNVAVQLVAMSPALMDGLLLSDCHSAVP